MKKCDTIARVGGDEFTILLQDISDGEAVVRVAQKVCDALKEPWSLGNHDFHITISIGIALFPNDGTDAETLLKHADTAMYQSKEKGQNNFQFYTPEMHVKTLQRLEIERNLRRALELGEFVVYYQPQVEVKTGQILGVEALVRWQHPQKGIISPAEFIPIAENTGLILPIGEFVLRAACTQIKAWQDAGYTPIRVAINISGRQFQQHTLVQTVKTILQETGLDPHWLELEITESVAMQDVEFTSKLLFELRDMGIKIAIDDFGTGYSSLNYLKRLPIDKIKIDRSFIGDITIDPDDATIVGTIILLAHNLKMKVLAEGVETNNQLCFLKDQDCDELQGYFFSKPLPAEDLTKILPKNNN